MAAEFPPAAESDAEVEPVGMGHAAFVCALECAARDESFVAACDASDSITVTLADDGSATVDAGDASVDVSADDIAAHMAEEKPELAKLASQEPGASA